MNAEPQKFFVGLIDLFSIWLPGAILAFVLREDARAFGQELRLSFQWGSLEGWAAFLLASYLLGHFIFAVGAIVFDRIDKRVRQVAVQRWRRVTGQIEEPIQDGLTQRERHEALWKIDHIARSAGFADKLWKPFDPLLAWIGNVIFSLESWAALDTVRALKRERLRGIDGDPGVNCFQWSKARLAVENPEALALVQRFEADSKFFRSLGAVLAVLAVWSCLHERDLILITSLILLPAAVARFLDLRAKSTSQAYWLVLALESAPPKEPAKA